MHKSYRPDLFRPYACLDRIHFLRDHLVEQAICCGRSSQWDIIDDDYDSQCFDLRFIITLRASLYIFNTGDVSSLAMLMGGRCST
jgi:hypothetical protein